MFKSRLSASDGHIVTSWSPLYKSRIFDTNHYHHHHHPQKVIMVTTGQCPFSSFVWCNLIIRRKLLWSLLDNVTSGVSGRWYYFVHDSHSHYWTVSISIISMRQWSFVENYYGHFRKTGFLLGSIPLCMIIMVILGQFYFENFCDIVIICTWSS